MENKIKYKDAGFYFADATDEQIVASIINNPPGFEWLCMFISLNVQRDNEFLYKQNQQLKYKIN